MRESRKIRWWVEEATRWNNWKWQWLSLIGGIRVPLSEDTFEMEKDRKDVRTDFGTRKQLGNLEGGTGFVT